MGPPPPRNPNPQSNPNPEPPGPTQTLENVAKIDAENVAPAEETTPKPEQNPSPNPKPDSDSSGSEHSGVTIPYSIPPWSEPPGQPFFFEVLKDGAIVEQLDVSTKGAFMFGRIDLCDFVLEHPTISRFHAVLQFKQDGEAFLYDLGSTHGTFINKCEVKKKEYTKVHVGDVIRFGHSSRLYIFQGPSELMPPEGDLEKLRAAKALREEMIDREASLARARVEASLADGVSWGMTDDAVEEPMENDGEDEITWQTYKGQLTERQEKTRGKILKRMEKVANMKKEIDAIRAKDISQGGLTQGQQTQIARNEQRMSQIMEELESLEETLNESIQESLGARSGKITQNRKPGIFEEEDDILSDDDDFYDRTKKKKPSAKKPGEQSVETADTLLDKKEAIVNKMEEKKVLLLKEKDKQAPTMESSFDGVGGDDLDAYMSGLTSQLVVDKVMKIEKELSDLQSELDRTLYLLKIADPLGDAARKREEKAKGSKPKQLVIDMRKQPQLKQMKPVRDEKRASSSPLEGTPNSSQEEKSKNAEKVEDACENEGKKAPVYTVIKPQWLGDTKDMNLEEDRAQETAAEATESDSFVDYKDRKKVLASVNDETKLENAAPGLIIRKRKPVEKPEQTVDKAARVEGSPSSDADTTVVDSVALLLKHKRGYSTLDEEASNGSQQSHIETSQPKRVLGPSKPDFLERSPNYETWVPPEGQTGDGRTSLNDRLGY
ncbi:kanadaptin [Asparagus officinalis]|uniref:kanadaptin n=1 Tax=Asparagus officinalis TaxID=4686 RepID=UPI00098E082B|nr:kanadaptin [Asparagus officinalis]